MRATATATGAGVNRHAPLSGTAAVDSYATGTLRLAAALTGTSAASASATGVPVARRCPVVRRLLNATGAARLAVALSGTAAATSGASGELFTEGQAVSGTSINIRREWRGATGGGASGQRGGNRHKRRGVRGGAGGASTAATTATGTLDVAGRIAHRAQARRRVAQAAHCDWRRAGRGFLGRPGASGPWPSIAVWLPPARGRGPPARWRRRSSWSAVRHDHGYQQMLTPVDRGLVTECRGDGGNGG